MGWREEKGNLTAVWGRSGRMFYKHLAGSRGPLRTRTLTMLRQVLHWDLAHLATQHHLTQREQAGTSVSVQGPE